jgi:hypothetical protein
MSVVFLWVALAAFVGVLASIRSRNGFGWFLLALIFSPLLAGICLLVAPVGGRCKCLFCAESIGPEAKVCMHCGHDVVRAAAPKRAPAF